MLISCSNNKQSSSSCSEQGARRRVKENIDIALRNRPESWKSANPFVDITLVKQDNDNCQYEYEVWVPDLDNKRRVFMVHGTEGNYSLEGSDSYQRLW